jgi:hypothetical protein
VWIRNTRFREGLLETIQIMMYCLTVEMIYYPSFATRSCTFNLLFGSPVFYAVRVNSIDDGVFKDGFASRLIL